MVVSQHVGAESPDPLQKHQVLLAGEHAHVETIRQPQGSSTSSETRCLVFLELLHSARLASWEAPASSCFCLPAVGFQPSTNMTPIFSVSSGDGAQEPLD